MYRCEECDKEFKTSQAYGAHKAIYHRTDAALESLRAEQQQKTKRIAELENGLSSKSERLTLLEHKVKVGCPNCKRLIWNELPVEECPKKSFDIGHPKKWCWVIGKEPMVKYRICPSCGYFEEIDDI